MTGKVWSGRDFKPVKTLSGHEAKVTSVDVLGVYGILILAFIIIVCRWGHIVTVSHYGTIKLWSSNSTNEQAMDVD
ncbi:hypothetical protein VNO80_14460 [Phaseolus coccineus]|uniref:Uncharacterized protein n=1 Tax=Phaseolus coccineus TaxID=3886 RepID=A0AAN9MJS4_PHACN